MQTESAQFMPWEMEGSAIVAKVEKSDKNSSRVDRNDWLGRAATKRIDEGNPAY